MKEKRNSSLMCFGIVFIVVVSIFAIIYKTFGFYYAINDDTSMRGIVSGAFDGIPDGHMIYIRYIIGLILSSLYKLNNGVDWYGTFMIGVLVISIACIVYKLVVVLYKKRQFILFTCILFMMYILMFQQITAFQWTMVAAFPTVAVLVLLVLKENRYKIDWEMWMIVLLSLISFSIRKTVFYMAIPSIVFIIVFLYILPLYKQGEFEKGKIISVFVPIIIILFSFLLIEVTDRIAYENNSAWKEYRRFNAARSDIQDYGGFPSYEGNEQLYEELGLSKYEADCLPQFGVMLNVDSSMLEKIAEYNNKNKIEMSFETKVANTFLIIKNLFTNREYLCWNILLGISLLFLIILTIINRKNILLKALFIVSQMVILFYLAYMGRFPRRIMFVYEIYSIFICIAFLINELDIRCKKEKTGNILGCFFLLILCGVAIFQKDDIIQQRLQYNTLTNETNFVNEYVASQGDSIVVIGTGTFNTKEQFIFHKDVTISNRLGTAGWSLHTPYMDNKKEQLGIGDNELFLLKENVQFLTRDLGRADIICNYYSLHTENIVCYEVIDSITTPNGAVVYVCRFYENIINMN